MALFTTISPLLAQNGQVEIVVQDPTGQPLPSFEVSLTCRDAKKTAQTDAAGRATFTGLPVGDCDLHVAGAGFAPLDSTYTITGFSPQRLFLPLRLFQVNMGDVVIERSRSKRFRFWRKG